MRCLGNPGRFSGKIANLDAGDAGDALKPLTGNVSADLLLVGAIRYRYNALGELVQTQQTNDAYSFDYNPPATVTQEIDYRYDTQGNRLQTHTLRQGGSDALDADSYYDTQGRVVATQNIQSSQIKVDTGAGIVDQTRYVYGVVNQTRYDAAGNKAMTFSSWLVDPSKGPDLQSGNVQTWSYDLATNHLLRYVDLGGDQTSYLYDLAGDVLQQTDLAHSASGASASTASGAATDFDTLVQSYGYDQAGHRTVQVSQTTTAAGQILWQQQRTRYDADGRETWSSLYDHALADTHAQANSPLEHVIAGTGYAGEGTVFADPNVGFAAPAWTQATTYDAAGRVASLGSDTLSTAYYYDAAGNRRAIYGATLKDNGWNASSNWYDYDTLNRQTLSEVGIDSQGNLAVNYGLEVDLLDSAASGIVQGSALIQSGVGLAAGATGKLAYANVAQNTGIVPTATTDFRAGGSAILYLGASSLARTIVHGPAAPSPNQPATNLPTDHYHYDALGELDHYLMTSVDAPAPLQDVHREFDFAGRIDQDQGNTSSALSRTSRFNADGLITQQIEYSGGSANSTVRTETDYTYDRAQGNSLTHTLQTVALNPDATPGTPNGVPLHPNSAPVGPGVPVAQAVSLAATAVQSVHTTETDYTYAARSSYVHKARTPVWPRHGHDSITDFGGHRRP